MRPVTDKFPVRLKGIVTNIEVIAVFLRWEFATLLDEVPELRDLAFKFARLILGINPVEYFEFLLRL